MPATISEQVDPDQLTAEQLEHRGHNDLARARARRESGDETRFEWEQRLAANADPETQAVFDPAFCGLAGRVVRAIEPHSEADPYGLLLTFLAAFGAAVGRGPHALADGAEHPARLDVLLVGPTAKGRKGTTWQQVRRPMALADPGFIDERILGGFGSGEALVDAAADGDDHRLFVLESEWGRLLAVGRREGSTLSPLIRQAWDGDRLAVRSRAGKAVADGAHVCVLGHITADELRAKLLDVDMANGFANRHLFCEVRRSKLLPSGGNLDDSVVAELGREIRDALERARKIGIMRRTAMADALWEGLYRQMADDDPGGLVAALIARDAPQVLRLSVVYALLDGASRIDTPHLQAAWSVWQYCRASVVSLFGERTGDSMADKLLNAALQAGPDGLTTTDQHAVVGRHASAARLNVARETLIANGSAFVRTINTGGRPATVLVAAVHGETSELSEVSTTIRPLVSLSSHTSQVRNRSDDGPPPLTDADAPPLDADFDEADY